MAEIKLTEKQKQFCLEYIIDLNATQAAIRAGYSKDTAKEQASRLLTNVNVQNYISELVSNKKKSTIATADEVLEYLTRVVRNEETEDITTKQGDMVIDCKTAKLSDRTKAAELLAKRYALLTDKVDSRIDGEIKISVVYEE